MKPVLINYLLKEKLFEKVIYADCDIHFFDDYQFLLDELDVNNVLITPHWRSSDPHIDNTNFSILYTSGIYNGGFIGVNKYGTDVMDWWAKACEFVCIKDESKGMFVDQVHLNLLPVYFDKISILKHRGCNVANWNMVECGRSLAMDKKTVMIAAQYPVVFIHFTKSTIDGILGGADGLLLPHLQQYYASINAYSSDFGFPELHIVPPEQQVACNKNTTTQQKNQTKTKAPYRDNFIDIPFTTDNLDRYLIRTNILKGLTESLQFFKGPLLDIGCGKMPYKEYILQHSLVTSYIGLDIETALVYDLAIIPDYTWDGIHMPFEDAGFETAIATEVLEHCPRPGLVLSEVNRVLKPGGVFFFTVPFLWPLHEVPHDEFRYTPFSLQRLLTEAGFVNIDIKATGGWHASLAQMLGLWVRRAPLTDGKRRILSWLIKPVIKILTKKDSRLGTAFNEGEMITGLWCTAKKN